jgi:hypothetical protein
LIANVAPVKSALSISFPNSTSPFFVSGKYFFGLPCASKILSWFSRFLTIGAVKRTKA